MADILRSTPEDKIRMSIQAQAQSRKCEDCGMVHHKKLTIQSKVDDKWRGMECGCAQAYIDKMMEK